MSQLDHLEIEHKFIVDANFDLEKFKSSLRALQPQHETEVDVRDTYYVPMSHTPCVLRHRYDRELQHLTMKSIGEKDSEVRTEVNLDLGQHKGNQSASVRAFLQPFEILWSGELQKKVNAFHFPKCEVVHYVATTNVGPAGEVSTVACVEFEATDCSSIIEAVQTIVDYEQKLGFDARSRSKISLFEMLLAPAIPAEIRNRLLGRTS